MKRIEDIPLSLDAEKIGAKLHMERIAHEKHVKALVEAAKPLIAAKAVYEVSYIDQKGEDRVIIDGIPFKSRVLRKNLDTVGRVFPYVVTIGKGLEEKAKACEDLIEQYVFDRVGNIALVLARRHLENHLRSRFFLGGMSYMSPGSLEDWPIQEQEPLFSIFRGRETRIGVRLNENLLMIPKKSLSGIFFQTEVTFHSCQLCPRNGCEGRRAAYDEKLAREYGLLK
jgi:hypothetical protein